MGWPGRRCGLAPPAYVRLEVGDLNPDPTCQGRARLMVSANRASIDMSVMRSMCATVVRSVVGLEPETAGSFGGLRLSADVSVNLLVPVCFATFTTPLYGIVCPNHQAFVVGK